MGSESNSTPCGGGIRMFCDEVLELIEPIAAGDIAADERVASHLASCANCSTTLAEARRLEQLLRGRAVLKAPPQFTSRVIGRIRRDRWRREQFLDAGFNTIVGLVALTLIVALWVVLSWSGVGMVGREAWNMFNSVAVSAVWQSIAPSFPLYFAAVALVLTALGVWWWAERETI